MYLQRCSKSGKVNIIVLVQNTDGQVLRTSGKTISPKVMSYLEQRKEATAGVGTNGGEHLDNW